MWKVAVLCVLALATATYGKEVCCRRIGCFNKHTNGVMSHLPDPRCPDDLKLKFVLATRETNGKARDVSMDALPSYYNPGRLTIMTSHGWMGESDMGWMNELVEALLNKFDANVFVADWEKGSKKIYYPKAAANVATVGAEIGLVLQDLVQNYNDSFDNMWCIGFSLGAHVCGHAGMKIGGKLGRATGLDPAGPSFHKRTIMNGINPTAAQFVDIIHSDGGGLISYYGLLESRGHVDFYPNGGRDQPGCYFGKRKRDVEHTYPHTDCIDFDGWVDPESCPYNIFIGCDHYRGIYYFLDTLKQDKCHVARQKCHDPTNIPKSCVPTENTIMGALADRNKFGLFYLETRGRSPYCLY